MISIDLSGHVALVTGASRGLGAGIVLRLAEAGAAVVINHRASAPFRISSFYRFQSRKGQN